jgi:hypothetical protein
MSSHPVAVLRFAGRLVAVLGIAGGLAFGLLGFGSGVIDAWIGLAYLGCGAVMAGHLAASLDLPRGAAAADDELVGRSETRSNAVGYWATLFTFLPLFSAVRRDAIPAEAALSLLALPLGLAPVLYMIVAFLRGRAG